MMFPWHASLSYDSSRADILTASLFLGNSVMQHLPAFDSTTLRLPEQRSTRTVEMILNSKLAECEGRIRWRSPRAAASCSADDEPSRRWSSRTRSRCGNRRSEHLTPGTVPAITTASWRSGSKREAGLDEGRIAAASGWGVGGGRGRVGGVASGTPRTA